MESRYTWFVAIVLIVIIGGGAYWYLTSQTPSIPSATTIPSEPNNFTSSGPLPQSPSQSTTPPPPTVAPSAPTTDMSKSPTALVTGLYTWYLTGLENDYRFAGSNVFISNRAQWLTENFASNWDSISARTEVDPLLLTQDIQSSWVTAIATSVLDQTATSSRVAVTLGEASSGHADTLVVQLLQTIAGWRVDAVTAK